MATMVGKETVIAELLNSLIEIELDATEAYSAAIERIEDEGDKAQLGELKGDHERHVRELSPLVESLGGEPADKPDIKRVLTKGKVVLAALAGDRPILLAMKTNEDDVNIAYDRAVSRDDLPEHVRELLVKNRDDARRHLAYVERRIADHEGSKERRPERTIEGDMPPTSAPGFR